MGENENQDLRAQLEQALMSDTPAEAQDASVEAPVETPVEAPQEAAPQTSTQEEAPQTPTQTPQQTPPPQTPPTMTPEQANMYSALLNRSAEAMKEMQAEIARLKESQQQQSQLAEQKIEEAVSMPTLDMSGWSYLTDEQRNERQAAFTDGMAKYFRSQMDSELAPIKAAYEQQRIDAEKQAAIAALSGDATFKGFGDSLPQIQNILDKTPALKNESRKNAYEIAYLINRGLQSMQNEGQRTAAQIAEEAAANPEVMRILESRRASQTAEKNAEVPVVTATSGMSNAQAVPTARPKTLDEAHALWKDFTL